MGTRERADRISKKFSNRTMQAVGFYVFDKCGNCVQRIPCLVEGTLKSGGHPDPLRKIITDLSNGCVNPKHYNGHGVVPRNVATVAGEICNGCPKFDICVENIEKYLRLDPETMAKVTAQAHKCVKCDRMDDCVQHYIDLFKLKNYKIAIEVFLLRFRDCSKSQKQLVSIDVTPQVASLPQTINIKTVNTDTPSNVGGAKSDNK